MARACGRAVDDVWQRRDSPRSEDRSRVVREVAEVISAMRSGVGTRQDDLLTRRVQGRVLGVATARASGSSFARQRRPLDAWQPYVFDFRRVPASKCGSRTLRAVRGSSILLEEHYNVLHRLRYGKASDNATARIAPVEGTKPPEP